MITQIQKRRCKRLALLLAFCLSLACLGAASRPDGRDYSREDAEMLAKTVWGEARGCGTTEQAAVVWCVLNRVESEGFPDSIREVVTQRGQFVGYLASNPVDSEILKLVYDVLARWGVEPDCIGGVGRVLPESYLYFSGTGRVNVFRETLRSKTVWDWSLESPYEEYDAEQAAAESLAAQPSYSQRIASVKRALH